jgi:hypothetical protein
MAVFMGEGVLDIRERTKALLLYVLDSEKPNRKVVKLSPTDIMEKLKKRDSVLDRRDSIVTERKESVLEKNESIMIVSAKKERESEKEKEKEKEKEE